jgi:hypothetical protein
MPKDQTVQETDGGAPGLLRAVSRWQIVALVLNDVIGSGVYLLPAGAAALLGGASVAAVVLAGLAVLLVVLCFAEAASHFDQPGSAYLYAREAFGELIGFEVGWMTWLARVASVASLAVAFAQALGYLWPEARAGWGRDVAIVLPVLALTALNVVGIRSGVRTAVLLAIAKIAPLLVFVAAGTVFALRGGGAVGAAAAGGAAGAAAAGGAAGAAVAGGAVGTAAAGGAGAVGWHQVGAAALLLLYAYAGFENTAAAAGEYKNPRRDVPFALLAQIGMVTVLYAWVQWVALATLPGLARRRGAAVPGPVGRLAADDRRDAVDPRHQRQHGPDRPSLPLRPGAGRLRSAAAGVRATTLPHAGGGGGGADGDRAAAGALRHLHRPGGAVGGGAPGYLCRHRGGGAGAAPQAGQPSRRLPPARRPAGADRGRAHLHRVRGQRHAPRPDRRGGGAGGRARGVQAAARRARQ